MKLLTWILLGVMLAGFALAAPAGGQVTVGATERGSGTASAGVTTEAGNLTEVNISGNPITTRWASFWGEISGGIFLGDASDNIFFEWAVTDPTGGYVYASNDTISDWSQGNIQAAGSGEMPSYLIGDASDNFSNTFSTAGDFNSSSLDVANVPYTTSWQNGSQKQNYTTYALQSAADGALIWAANVVADLVSFKGTGSSTDYQLLVPANASGETYNFYLEFK